MKLDRNKLMEIKKSDLRYLQYLEALLQEGQSLSKNEWELYNRTKDFLINNNFMEEEISPMTTFDQEINNLIEIMEDGLYDI